MHQRCAHPSSEKRKNTQCFDALTSVTPLGFDKMLPRDNMMFNLNDGYNLKPKPEPSIIEKLASMDIDIRKLRIKHTG